MDSKDHGDTCYAFLASCLSPEAANPMRCHRRSNRNRPAGTGSLGLDLEMQSSGHRILEIQVSSDCQLRDEFSSCWY